MNHKDEAVRLLDHALNKPSDTDGFFEVQAALAAALIALVEAQEAANEQARIANLIALALYTGDNNMSADLLRAEAMDALVEWVPHTPDGEHPEVRHGIAAALVSRQEGTVSDYSYRGVVCNSAEEAALAAEVPAYGDPVEAVTIAQAVIDSDWLEAHDRALAAKIQAVKELHMETYQTPDGIYCRGCIKPYPCPTRRLLEEGSAE